MDWLDPIRRAPDGDPDSEDPEDEGPTRVKRAAPGIAELFRGLGQDQSHAVLDLGPSEAAHFRIYSRFARQIRFAGLLPLPPRGAELTAALEGLGPPPRQPFDVVLMWNILDRLGPGERPPLVRRLAELTGPGARLYAVMDATDATTLQPLRFTLVDMEHVSQEPAGPPRGTRHRLLPAQVERLLRPFEVVRAFTLRVGLREYVAVKGEGEWED